MYEIQFGKGYTELPSVHRDWISIVKECVKIAQREHDYIVSIKHRPDRESERDIWR